MDGRIGHPAAALSGMVGLSIGNRYKLLDLDCRFYYLNEMSRPSKFSAAQILDTAATLVAADGPGAATIGAISARLKAPSGSIYHRFASRDVLLGRLWLDKA